MNVNLQKQSSTCFFVLSMLLFFGGCQADGPLITAKKDVQPPIGFREVGGSNYVMYSVAESYRIKNEKNIWWVPGVLEPVIGYYHRKDDDFIRHQLRTMYANGQRKIAVLVWIGAFDGDADDPDMNNMVDGLLGHCIVMENGELREQHIKNTRDLIALIQKTGWFNELIFRFAFQGCAGPEKWKKWNENQYQHNWRAIVELRGSVEQALTGSGMKVRYDLGAELGGMEGEYIPMFTSRLWKDYTRAYGRTDSYGFSIALHPGRVARMLKVFQEVGVYPDVYAIDVYDHLEQWLPEAVKEFHNAGVPRPQIIIQETYYNDPEVLALLQKSGKEYGIDYLYLMQWPLAKGLQEWRRI
jgi:hypothetical protein